MRLWCYLLVTLAPAFGESHPSWWTLAPVDTTAIVGIQWQSLKNSPFAAPVAAELGSSIGLPELPCLTEARQILIASPPMLALIDGDFAAETLRAQAAKLAMKPATYHGVNLWIPTGKATLSIARLSDQLLLAGARATLETAIDRSFAERRHYSPLLARAARYAQSDLFVVADRLPDPLAGIFVPIEGQTRGFDGYVVAGEGLSMEASLDAGSEDNAAAIAESIRQSIPSLPEAAQSLKVRVDSRNVFLSLELDSTEFSEALRSSPAPKAPPRPVAVAPKAPEPQPKPTGPQVIRIYGLDGGTREIVLPPAKPDKPR